MTAKELKDLLVNVPDDTVVDISIWEYKSQQMRKVHRAEITSLLQYVNDEFQAELIGRVTLNT